jgi:hypothetical protein
MPISPATLNGYDFSSNAEKEIYKAAFESGYFNNTERYLFHSLNMVKTGDGRVKGEIDFVYLDNECILFFEVKGGEVKFNSLTNEWWVLGGTQKGNPFTQAYKCLFQTRDYLLPDLFKEKSIPGRLIYGIGVLFPDSITPNEFRKTSQEQMEFDPELVYDYNDHKQKRLIKYIEKIKKYWAAHPQFSNRLGLSSKEVSAISKYFRQDLHFKLPVSDLLEKSDSETQRLTGMQFYVLDNLELNLKKGGLIMGGPGTGKTILAIELLKRKLEEGKKTLFVCYNKNLAEHLIDKCKKLRYDGDYKISNIHYLYKDKSFLKNEFNEPEDSSAYWSRELPLFFIKNIVEAKKQDFDYVIVDEGQDILNEYHFDALSKLLKGGLESGNWAVFMDKDYQNIYNKDAEEYFIYLRDAYPCFINQLQLNCRNTLSTIKRASIQTGFPEMSCLRTDDIWKSEIKYYSSETDLKNRINDTILKMEKDGIDKKYITILTSERTQLLKLIESNPNRYEESAFVVAGKINVSTIHAYKGLENKFIVICGPQNFDPNDKKQMSLIFIGNTRATAQSIFFLDKRFEQIIINRITGLN